MMIKSIKDITGCYGHNGDGKHGPCPYWDNCLRRLKEEDVPCKYEVFLKYHVKEKKDA